MVFRDLLYLYLNSNFWVGGVLHFIIKISGVDSQIVLQFFEFLFNVMTFLFANKFIKSIAFIIKHIFSPSISSK